MAKCRTKIVVPFATGIVALLASAPAVAKSYKGAELYGLNPVHYGRMEMRMRMIRGSGLLSSFFTYKNGSEVAGAVWEEIDIEIFGKDPKSWQTNIITGSPKQTSEQVVTAADSLADGFHTYALEWTPDYVAWFLDGTQVRKTQGGQVSVLTNGETLRFNAWSSESADWVGTFDENALPAYQFINWIKYYRYDNGHFTLDWTDEFNSFDSSRWAKGDWSFDGNRVDFDPANVVVKDGMMILALTREGQTGFNGQVPADNARPDPGASGGTGGAAGGSGGRGGAGGTAGNTGAGGAGVGGSGGRGGEAGTVAGSGGAGASGSGGRGGEAGAAAGSPGAGAGGSGGRGGGGGAASRSPGAGASGSTSSTTSTSTNSNHTSTTTSSNTSATSNAGNTSSSTSGGGNSGTPSDANANASAGCSCSTGRTAARAPLGLVGLGLALLGLTRRRTRR